MKFSDNDTCDLVFSELSSTTKEGKVLLHKLNGMFEGGALVAIIGSSGSGKTTLLNVLSGYRFQNAEFRMLQMSGVDTTFEHLASISCYLTQDIHLNDLLTIEENMRFAADFKLGEAHCQMKKNTIVEELLYTFGLTMSKNTRAGKLSGGERKRLALALEMISDPQIIFLDEPTTGLDISTTRQILEYFKKITTSGKTVICTIHQVCASHFDLFDVAYVIAEGKCTYHGRPQDLVPFLDSCGIPCNIYHDPVEHLIEVCSRTLETDNVGHFVAASQNGHAYVHQQFKQTKTSTNNIDEVIFGNTTWRYQFKTLLRREATKILRNSIMVPMRILGSNLISFFIGLLFWNFSDDASKVIYNYQFCLAIVLNIMLTGMLYPVIFFPSEMELLKRELHNRYYTLLQYYISIFVVDLPISILTISTSSILVWSMNGQQMDLHRIFVYQLFMITFGTVINAIGFFFGTLNTSLQTAIVSAAFSQLPLILISGYGLYFRDVPWFLQHVSRLFYLRSAVEGALAAMFGISLRKLRCPEEEHCFIKDPYQFLEFVGVDPEKYLFPFCILVMWLVIFRVVTYYSMKYRLSL